MIRELYRKERWEEFEDYFIKLLAIREYEFPEYYELPKRFQNELVFYTAIPIDFKKKRSSKDLRHVKNEYKPIFGKDKLLYKLSRSRIKLSQSKNNIR